LKACSEAIIPVEPSLFSLHGIARLMETLDLLARKSSHDILARALITLYSTRSEFGKMMAEEIRQHLGNSCFKTFIRLSAKLPEAVGQGLPISEFSRRSAGFADYQALAREVLEQESPEKAVSSATVAQEVHTDAAPIQAERNFQPGMEAAPPRRVAEGILFTLDAPGARCVQLVGDFNGWAADGGEMESNGRIWRKVVPLPIGRYQYRYVVDGRWLPDPLNVNVEPTPWGGYNSVVNLNETDIHNWT
jgi:hypothetical protein